MQATRSGAEASRRTFTEAARRAQIIAAAIETLAEVGYARASFAQIARRAGLSSTGLISYHFAAKSELIGEVVRHVVGQMGQFMAGQMAAASGPRDALRIYIEGNCAFIADHPAEMKALLEIFVSGGFDYGAGDERKVVSPLEGILRAGQEAAEFRDFDVTVMATLIQRAVDGLPFLLAVSPDQDIAAYAREVGTAFDLATRVAS
ncbi:MAG TPA: TetR family transcriptional regulator [Trebonia sp.]|jgi:AcrR family transcriptional regulator|nr:TetR family transcriptional regulator [Trebonia sp.]